MVNSKDGPSQRVQVSYNYIFVHLFKRTWHIIFSEPQQLAVQNRFRSTAIIADSIVKTELSGAFTKQSSRGTAHQSSLGLAYESENGTVQQSSQEIAVQHSHEQPILEIPQQSSADQADDVDENGMNILPAFALVEKLTKWLYLARVSS